MRLFERTKTIPWGEFFKREDPNMVTLRVIPDRTVDNRGNYKLIRALHELYAAPLGRLSFGKWFISYRPKERFWYDVLLTQDEIKFYFTVPKRWEDYTKQKISNTWPRASVEVASRKELAIPLEDTRAAELVYKRHNIFALHCDRTEDTQPLGAILGASSDMQEGDLARLSVCADPIHRLNWQDQADQAHKLFSKGKTPQRRGLSKRKALVSAGTALEGIFASLGDLALAVLGHGDDKQPEQDMEKRQILIDGRLGSATGAKKTEPTFKALIRVASHSADASRREMTCRALSNSFVEIAGDNELERVDASPRATVRIIYELNTHRLKPGSVVDLDSTIMGASELGKVMQLPGPGLQDAYSEQLDTIKLRQEAVPAAVSSGGLGLGVVECKAQNTPVYLPTKNYDELCLPSVVIAGMGMGKTKGFAANTIVEMVINGMGALGIDPGKGEIYREVAAALPPDKIIHIDLGVEPIALDWRETAHAGRVNARLANTILSFFNTQGDDAGLQTERYLRAAIMGMQTRRVSEILKIFEDKKHRSKVVMAMPEGLNRTTLQDFGNETEGMQRKILTPIYNRMAVILGDEYLEQCMECENGLDMVELMQQKKAVIISIPANQFDPLAIDLLVNLISTKVDLAMRLRPEEKQFPYGIILDEPHQYLKSVSLWKAAAVESRKWRAKYCWLFHSWEQIPTALAEIIKSAGPHYHLYRSSQRTFRDLALEIAPFTIDEGLKLPSFYAINVIRADYQTIKPFMAKMLAPPSQRFKQLAAK